MTTEEKIAKLSCYTFDQEDINNIRFDQYGRPYIQDAIGKLMLRKNTKYNYTIKN